MYKIPSQQQLDILIKSYQSQDYKKSKQLAILLTKEFPNHAFGWKALSMVLKKKGEIKESLEASLKVIERWNLLYFQKEPISSKKNKLLKFVD